MTLAVKVVLNPNTTNQPTKFFGSYFVEMLLLQFLHSFAMWLHCFYWSTEDGKYIKSSDLKFIFKQTDENHNI